MAKQVEEVEDDEFEAIVQENRHKELISTIKKLMSVIEEDKSIASALEKNTKEIGNFVDKVKSLKPPEVTVQTNQESVVNEIRDLGLKITESLEKQNEVLEKLAKEKEVEFKMNRLSNGVLDSVIVKQKYK